MKSGMVGFSNNKRGLLPKLIRFFTDSSISHTFVITEPLCNEVTVQEAALLVQVVPFEKYYIKDNTQSYWLYKINPAYASQEAIDASLKYCFKEFAGVEYGKLQLVWFVYRWLMGLIGKDVTHEKNWMADGVICSELTYHYLWNLGPVFQELLKKFNPDTVQAEDLRQIAEANPHIFELVEYKI